MNNIVQIRNLYKSYKSGLKDELRVLIDLDLDVRENEILVIVGDSGCGKSTLLNLIGCIDKPNCGEIIINGKAVMEMNDKQLAYFRNKNIGFVFQAHHLISDFTALENIMMPMLLSNVNFNDAKKKSLKLLKLLNLEDRAFHKPGELSGGECQRVALLRALANQPAIVLADEPTGNLDKTNAILVQDLFLKLNRKFNQTFIIVTHNERFSSIADRVLRLSDGKLYKMK